MPVSSVVADKMLNARRLATLGVPAKQISILVNLHQNKFKNIVAEVLEEQGKESLSTPGPRKLVKSLMNGKGAIEASVYINYYIRIRGLEESLRQVHLEDLLTAYKHYLVIREGLPESKRQEKPLSVSEVIDLVYALLITDVTEDDLDSKALVHQCSSNTCGAYYYIAIDQNRSSNCCPVCNSDSTGEFYSAGPDQTAKAYN